MKRFWVLNSVSVRSANTKLSVSQVKGQQDHLSLRVVVIWHFGEIQSQFVEREPGYGPYEAKQRAVSSHSL